MNRQLKFRVWDKLEKRLIYPDKGYQGHFVLNLNGRFQNLQNGSGGEEYVVQQFASLKDKDGKDIYEGDIILNSVDHDRPTICVVGWSVYEEIGFSLYYPFKEPMEPLKQNFNGIDLYEEYPMCYNRGYGYEVIGNIFENLELL